MRSCRKPEQALLRRLGVFAGSFSLPAATAVTAGTPIAAGEVFDLVAKLVEKSLVMPLQAGERNTLPTTGNDTSLRS